MAVLLKAYRDILVENTLPDIFLLTCTLIVSLIMIIISLFMYRRLEFTLPRVVLE